MELPNKADARDGLQPRVIRALGGLRGFIFGGEEEGTLKSAATLPAVK